MTPDPSTSDTGALLAILSIVCVIGVALVGWIVGGTRWIVGRISSLETKVDLLMKGWKPPSS